MADTKDFAAQITSAARDSAYVVVGLAVLGFQRAQVRRRELQKALSEPGSRLQGTVSDVRGGITRQFHSADSTVEAWITRFESSIEPFEQRLPEGARRLVHQAQSQARDAREQLRGLLPA